MSSTHSSTHSTAHLSTTITRMITAGLLTLLTVTSRAGRRLRDRLRAGITASRAEPDAGYSAETVVVTSLLVGVAVVVFGTIFWNDITSYAKTIFDNITHA